MLFNPFVCRVSYIWGTGSATTTSGLEEWNNYKSERNQKHIMRQREFE
jgi:hypothetical protein